MIERRQAVPREEFFDRYRDANRPLILTEAMRNWPAMTRWKSISVSFTNFHGAFANT
jgi:hypothetical protein